MEGYIEELLKKYWYFSEVTVEHGGNRWLC